MALFALMIGRWLKRDPTLKVSTSVVLLQTGIISVYFEWYLPYHSARSIEYTSDWLDVLMYFVGAILFLLIQKRL